MKVVFVIIDSWYFSVVRAVSKLISSESKSAILILFTIRLVLFIKFA